MYVKECKCNKGFIQMSFQYPPNERIIEAFVALQEIHPPLYNSDEDIPSVKAWLKHIKNLGFNDEMIQEIIIYFYKLKNKQSHIEASQILLVSAATEHALPNFILARELMGGQLFTKNHTVAFSLLDAQANKGHLESKCDLAYFYKNGLVVPKDITVAKQYYTEAAQGGLKRAKQALEQLTAN